MDKLKMHSPDLSQENIEKIRSLFPNCVTEANDENGKLKLAIDFDQLKQELSDSIVEGPQERYHLNWPGKKQSLLNANSSAYSKSLDEYLTLRPIPKESLNFDSTENLFIEGDNLDSLKLLQETYLEKIKLIYIDPPYNTGKDFVYDDDFKISKKEHDQASGTVDTEGNILFDQERWKQNADSNGRFHSDWLSMMYSRLVIARRLLREDGVLFISIDDNENHNLRKLCEEVFGDNNILSELVWHLSSGPQAGHFTRSNESIIAVAKNKSLLPYFKDKSGGTIKHGALKKISAANPASEIVFPKGSIKFEGDAAQFPDELGGSEKQYITKGKLRFENGTLAEDVTIKAGWGMKNQVLSWLKGEQTFDSKGQKVLRFYFNPKGILFYEKERGTVHPKTVIPSSEVGGTKVGGDEIEALFGKRIMSFPKPTGLLKFLINTVCEDGDIILDFFAGSGTTGDAVMQLNAGDNGKRKFILIQIPEMTPKNSEAHKQGFETISAICCERLKRVAIKLSNESEFKKIDFGFRKLHLTSTSMKEVYYRPDQVDQTDMFAQVENIKEDRTDEDLLFQVLLDWGVGLTLPISKQQIASKDVFYVNADEDGEGADLIACFSTNISNELIKELAEKQPLRVVFRDDGFANDSVKINVEQIFKQISPITDVKSI